MTMTPDARDALARAGFSRRDFLKGAGALVVTFSAAPGLESVAFAQGPFGTQAQNAPINPKLLDSWIAVAADGTVTAYSGKCEFGQGIYTAQMQLVAEELSVPLSRVKLVYCDTSLTPDQGITSGSQSTPTNFNDGNLALAGATAREALLRLGAERLGVPVGELSAADGVVSAKNDSSKRVSYGDLVAGRKFNLPLSTTAKRKPASEWTILGKPVGRVDIPALVTAQAEFVHNVHVPGMLHGRVVRPPAAVGATLVGVDESSVRDVPGFVKVVVKKNFVGVVAEKPWQAIQAANKLKVTWTAGPGLPSQRDFYDRVRKEPARDAYTVNSKDVDAVLPKAGTVVKATYLHPYQMHGSVGSSCAVADVREGKVTIWSATQAVWHMRSTAAMVLNVPVEQVQVVYTRGSGCYGINGADTVSYDAALMSQAVGRPVRVQLSRKDEMAWENYGNAFVIDQQAGIGPDGTIVAWDCESWVPTRGARPGYEQPGNVVSGWLAGFEPAPIAPRAAADPTGFNNGNNAAPSYVAGRVGATTGGTGKISSERVLTHTVASPFFTGPLRSPLRLQNTFAHESFIDEIAASVKADPAAYRLRHISDPRLIDVINAATKTANWTARPSPRPGFRRTGVSAGRGIACVLYEGNNGYCAMVADVEVDQGTGAVKVTRMVMGHDCGPMSNPDGVRNQLEGGALQGMSRAIGEEVTWDAQSVTSVDWRTFHSLPLGIEVPQLECVLINRTDVEAMGSGETSITLSAAAIGNAIFDATGARLREVPFTPARVKQALDARNESN